MRGRLSYRKGLVWFVANDGRLPEWNSQWNFYVYEIEQPRIVEAAAPDFGHKLISCVPRKPNIFRYADSINYMHTFVSITLTGAVKVKHPIKINYYA